MKLILKLILLFLLPLCPLFPDEPGLSQAKAEYEAFVKFYYKHKDVSHMNDAISFVGRCDFTSKPDAVFPVITFFAVIFSENPEKVEGWQELINQQNKVTQALFEKAIDLSKDLGKIFETDTATARFNDLCWAAFFASGDVKYISKVIANLKYCDERKDMMLFLAGASAKWSLSSNARIHAKVKKTLNAAALTEKDPRVKSHISEILNQTPSSIQQETISTLKDQKAKGIWGKEE